MIAFKLAYKNLMGAGLRTLLIVFVLSLAYVLIIYMNGIYQGWDRQARIETIAWEVAEGQYWQSEYDPYDAMTLTDAHAPVPAALEASASEGKAVPILITQATIYPEGRMMGAMLKGIDTRQKILSYPPTCWIRIQRRSQLLWEPAWPNRPDWKLGITSWSGGGMYMAPSMPQMLKSLGSLRQPYPLWTRDRSGFL